MLLAFGDGLQAICGEELLWRIVRKGNKKRFPLFSYYLKALGDATVPFAATQLCKLSRAEVRKDVFVFCVEISAELLYSSIAPIGWTYAEEIMSITGRTHQIGQTFKVNGRYVQYV